MNKKSILVVLSVLALVAASVFGTLAYLTDTDQATNTFTVGQVGLKLDEAEVNPDGSVKSEDRVQENDYHLLPGHTYIKDPTVTVEKDSEESYVRMMVTFTYSAELDAIFAPQGADMISIFNGYESANWALEDVTEDTVANTRTYEFRYIGEENQGSKPGTVKKAENAEIKLDALFDSITVPGFVDNADLATLVTRDDDGNIIDQFKINIVAHAIQADGFADADAAWAEF